MIRSIVAILTGIIALTTVSFGIEAVVNPLLLRGFPEALPSRAAISHNLAASLFTFAYGTLSVVVGGYVTAWIARSAPIRHSVIMGILQIALTILAMTAMWDQAPTWIWVSSIAMSLPAAALGGWWYAKRSRRTPAGSQLKHNSTR